MKETIFKKGDIVEIKDAYHHPYVKVGDKVKIACVTSHITSEDDIWLDMKKQAPGSICDCGKEHSWVFHPRHLKLVVSKKNKKEVPPKFLLKYDLDHDPVEEYATLKEVKIRIAALVKDADKIKLKLDSIVVYEIKKVYPIKVSTSVSIKGI